MNQGDGNNVGKRGRTPRTLISGIAHRARQDEHLVEFVAATLLTLIGLFFAWQSWLVIRETDALKQADEVRAWEVRQLGEEVARIRTRAQQAADSATVAKILGGDLSSGSQ